jgi:hypothetical protein
MCAGIYKGCAQKVRKRCAKGAQKVHKWGLGVIFWQQEVVEVVKNEGRLNNP